MGTKEARGGSGTKSEQASANSAAPRPSGIELPAPRSGPLSARYSRVVPSASPRRPKVFLSHRKADSAKAEALAIRLVKEFGIEVWFDGWEIIGGENFVLEMEDGLSRTDGALILLTEQGIGESWAREEYSCALMKSIEIADEHSEAHPFVIPVVSGNPAELPPFLSTRQSISANDVAGIAEAIFRHCHLDSGLKPALGSLWVPPAVVEFQLELRRDGDSILAQAGRGCARLYLPSAEAQALRQGLWPVRPDGFALGAETAASPLRNVGKRLGALFSGDVGERLLEALSTTASDGEVLIRLRSETDELLSLPWEAAHLDPLGPLALHLRTTIARELVPSKPSQCRAIPGPLRILAAVAAPSENLDASRELGIILDATDTIKSARPRLVFVDDGTSTLDGIREQLDAEPFHLLHVVASSCPGGLAFEDALGNAQRVDAGDLADALIAAKFPPQLVILSAGTLPTPLDTPEEEFRLTACLLVEAGVPQVIAMQGPVRDGYAGELARHLYERLATDSMPVAATALAKARRDVEAERLAYANRSEAFIAPQPEYATPVFYANEATSMAPLYDGTKPAEELQEPARLAGVPGLTYRPLAWIVGRRRLRRLLRATLEPNGKRGAVLWGMGGVGKSALAASMLERLVREGWSAVVRVGAFGLPDLVRAANEQLRPSSLSPHGQESLARLGEPGLNEDEQLRHLQALLANDPVMLLLDNFEDNLVLGHGRLPKSPEAEILPGVHDIVRKLSAAAITGAVLITCRYRLAMLPELESLVVPPLERSALTQLAWRLPGLMRLEPGERHQALELLGGHPRSVEFLDALLRARPGEWQAAFSDVTYRIRELAARAEAPLELPDELDEKMSTKGSVELAQKLATEDVLLSALLATLEVDALRFLGGCSIFRRAVPTAAVRDAVRAVGLDWDDATCRKMARHLVDRTLMIRSGGGSRPGDNGTTTWNQSWLVHRWTATTLQRQLGEEELRTVHVAAAKWWFGASTVTWEDALQGVDHFLAAQAWQSASSHAEQMQITAHQTGQQLTALALCERMITELGSAPMQKARWIALSARHLSVLGQLLEATERLERSVTLLEETRNSDPGNVEVVLWLCQSLCELGDHFKALGECEQAKGRYERALQLRQGLVESQPERLDLLREFAITFNRLGDLELAIGSVEGAEARFERAAAITEELVKREPGCTKYLDDACISFDRLGDLRLTKGKGGEAKHFYEHSLEQREKLLQLESTRADFLRATAVTLNKLGDLHRALGGIEEAKAYYERSLGISEQLVGREPDRTDCLCDLATCYEKLGDLQRAVANGDEAKHLMQRALEIRQELVKREPERSDLLLALAISFSNLGDLHCALGSSEEAKRLMDQGLEIKQQLVKREPERLDTLRDLGVSCNNLGDLYVALGDATAARHHYERALSIAEQLVERGPENSRYQGDLAVGFERMALVDTGQAIGWLDRAIAVHRQRLKAGPELADVRHDLASVLTSRAAINDSREHLLEAYRIYCELRSSGALEEQNYTWVDQMGQLLGQA